MTNDKRAIDIQLEKVLVKIKDIIASSNINFLIWSGASTPCLPTLHNIEQKLNNAHDEESKAEIYKEYFEKIILPNKAIIWKDFSSEHFYNRNNNSSSWVIKDPTQAEADYNKVNNSYKNLFQCLAQIICKRDTTILSKQVNIFSTNIDIFMEKALEDIRVDYTDGFSWKIDPIFDLSNFKRSFFQRSIHFDHKSEIPVFNLLKVHWSVNWVYENILDTTTEKRIFLKSSLNHFDKTLLLKSWEEFNKEYKSKILVVNPEDAKFSDTVLNKYYYELLRIYSSELEKENTVLFVIWFSMADQHIREITKRAARSNPTLQIYIILFSNRSTSWMKTSMETDRNLNITVLSPEYENDIDKYDYNLDTITTEIFERFL